MEAGAALDLQNKVNMWHCSHHSVMMCVAVLHTLHLIPCSGVLVYLPTTLVKDWCVLLMMIFKALHCK